MYHVLIIEDEPLIAMLLQDVLEDAGATSFSFAATQDEAVAAADDQLPNLITSDVRLRQGTGPLAVALIHERLGPVPVIFITGTPEDCHPCPEPGRVIAKPFNQNAVAQAFRQLCRS